MTRKRKIVQEQEDHQPTGGFEGYGFVEKNYGDYAPTFPEKRREYPEKRNKFERNNKRGGKRDQFDPRDFEKQYGRVGGDNAPSQEEPEEEEKRPRNNNDERGDFPKDIVGYLRSIDNVRKQEGKIEEFILDNCAKEIVGEETTLLEWTEAAVVVESVFGSCAYGAALFLEAISKLKHKKLINLFFGGASARTIENLMYKLCPIEKVEHVEMISKFVDILIDQWADTVSTQQSAYLIRAIIRISTGLMTQKSEKEGEKEEKPKFATKEMKNELKMVFEKLAALVFDENLNAELMDNPICSLVIQDAIDADALWKLNKMGEYVNRIVEKDGKGEKILKYWQQKNTSRIWEKIMEKCREETKSVVWMGAISGNVAKLANHQFANFPLQKLIGGVTSLELATDIIDEISPIFEEILASHKIGVVIAALKCASKHENVQEILLKQLRLAYRANKASTKTNFLFNILTNNNYDGQHLNLQNCTVHGSLLVQELVNFSKIKTITACIEGFSDQQIREMCCHKIASRVIQACLTSDKLEENVKMKIVGAFSSSEWEGLISDMYGSHVFEVIWKIVDLKKKQEIMNTISRINNHTKFWKFAMLKCDTQLWRKNKKDWFEKWRKTA